MRRSRNIAAARLRRLYSKKYGLKESGTTGALSILTNGAKCCHTEKAGTSEDDNTNIG